MDPYLLLVMFIVFGYICGSIPFGYLIPRLKNIDIRKNGSGNIGATNVSRALGIKYAIIVAILDIAKAVLPIYVASLYFKPGWEMALISISPIIGHLFPVWLNFKGGKGIATIFASIIMICGLKYSLIFLLAWGIMLYLIKIMSLNNLIVVLSLPLLFWISTKSTIYLFLGFLYIIVVYWSHRENIARLMNGTEKKIIK
jgi:acyl phosphate:glycerol-3-phosphate acyltransferase